MVLRARYSCGPRGRGPSHGTLREGTVPCAQYSCGRRGRRPSQPVGARKGTRPSGGCSSRKGHRDLPFLGDRDHTVPPRQSLRGHGLPCPYSHANRGNAVDHDPDGFRTRAVPTGPLSPTWGIGTICGGARDGGGPRPPNLQARGRSKLRGITGTTRRGRARSLNEHNNGTRVGERVRRDQPWRRVRVRAFSHEPLSGVTSPRLHGRVPG